MPADFVHRFEPATDPARPPLLLLHGTGGNEDDLLPLGAALAPGVALLSPRGQVLENGMPRFFRRFAEGMLDEEDLRTRTGDLATFIAGARERYGLGAPVAVGFSNGANIAASLLMLAPGVLAGAVLLRAMPPYRERPPAIIPDTPVMILSGTADPIVPPQAAARLSGELSAAGARVRHVAVAAGHSLVQEDLRQAAAFLEEAWGTSR